MFDIVIRNGDLLDGSGAEARRLDVGVKDGKIAALGDLGEAEAGEIIDAAGKTVCPGFLDLHRHADAALFREGYGDCDLYQGITTIGNGNCGLSLAPQAGPYREAIGGYLKPVTGDFTGIPVDTFADYMTALKARPLPVNALMLAGSGTIRSSVAGFQKLRLEDEDFAAIHARLEQALADGAGGVSLGLGYAPECYYTTEELKALAGDFPITDMIVAYGIKVGDAGLVATVEEGAIYASLNIAPSGVAVACNRIFNSFTFRKSYGVYGSSVSIAGGSSVFPLAILLDKERYAGDRVVRYTFLGGEDADYSGMANTVRQRMLDTGLLPSTPVAGEVPTVLDLLGGITEETLFFETYKKLTTFAQSEEILTDLTEAGVDSLILNLKGWADGGLTAAPQQAEAAGKLGGYRGLKSLAQLCGQKDVPLYLHVNYTDIYAGSGGYNLNTDAARDPNNYMYTNADEDHFLQGPYVALKKQKALLKRLQELPLAGLTFARLGALVYSDHYDKALCLADTTAAAWVKLLQTTKDAFGSVAVEGGNGYVLTQATLLRDIPEKSVSVLFGDETVPFFQMIVHGSAYYTGTQNNLFYDTAAQTLKMVEYGYVPYYELTYAPSKELRNTDYSTLFSCCYADWQESIVATDKAFSDRLAPLYGCYMTDHEAVAEDVYRVTYSNGTQVYVNYRETAYQTDTVTVEPKDFAVVTEGGN